MIVLSLMLFVTVAGFSSALGIWLLNRHVPTLERLMGGTRHRVIAVAGSSPALAWRDLVSRIGTTVPLSPKSAPRLKRLLLRAGYRNPAAIRIFHGVRAVCVILFAFLAGLLALRYRAADQLLLAIAGGAAAGYMAPMQCLRVRLRRRRRAIAKGLPNALDLMVVCVESGLGLDQTTVQVARELRFAYPQICDEFAVMNLELRAGKHRTEALHNLGDRTGVEDVRKLVAVLVQTERFGTSVAQTLRGHAEYMRVMARQRAEERAAKLAVKLVFPIFFCILPSLFVVTVGPVLTRLVRDLLPMIEKM